MTSIDLRIDRFKATQQVTSATKWNVKQIWLKRGPVKKNNNLNKKEFKN